MERRIYLADDDPNIRELEAAFLRQAGFSVELFADGDALLRAFEKQTPDLVILDVMMPGTDGLSVCNQLRKKSETLPIMIVSARDDPFDRVTGLTLGSDDYLVKPFLPLELVARVQALLRRAGGTKPEGAISVGVLSIDPMQRTAAIEGEPIALTPGEFDFLAFMAQHADRAVSREEILRTLWQYDWEVDTRAADDLVKRLRKKLRAASDAVRIETVWGYGFRLIGGEEK